MQTSKKERETSVRSEREEKEKEKGHKEKYKKLNRCTDWKKSRTGEVQKTVVSNRVLWWQSSSKSFKIAATFVARVENEFWNVYEVMKKSWMADCEENQRHI